ncbi:MAG: hypothetical protein ACYC63_13050 [Armatimonadota bacterium]
MARDIRIYLDTNVYFLIALRDECRAVTEYLRRERCSVLASEFVLGEMLGNPDAQQRQVELSVVASVATRYPKHPMAYRQAKEVEAEIRRCRPQWVNPWPDRSSIKAFLANHWEHWKQARAGQEPPPQSCAAYRKTFEKGVRASRAAQKTARGAVREGADAFRVVTAGSEVKQCAEGSLSDPEAYWRMNCLQVWHEAIVRRVEASRDYADWLGPFLKEGAFTDVKSYSSFWMCEARGEALRRNRISGLVDYYQLDGRVTHGNAGDQLHAVHLLDVDAFITADRPFHDVLLNVIPHEDRAARVALLKRNEPSVTEELRRILNSSG